LLTLNIFKYWPKIIRAFLLWHSYWIDNKQREIKDGGENHDRNN